MSDESSVHVPAAWTIPHKKMLLEAEDEGRIAFDELLRWVNETGLTTEEGAKIIFKNINAYYYLRCLYPVLPADVKSNKLFQLNLHFLILGYTIDDTIEKYNENEMKELVKGYNFLEKLLNEAFPKFPTISEMKKTLSNVKNNFSKSAIATLFDYVNKTTLILLEGGGVQEDKVVKYRKRLMGAITVYFEAILSKTKTGCEISERNMLWRRCFDSLAIAVYMPTEIFSKTLVQKDHILPVSEFYKFYLLSTLFTVVINDLYSYERDKLDDTDSVIKVWFKEKSVQDMSGAASKISKILNAIMQQMYLFVEEGKAAYPEFSDWFERVAFMTVGWIYIHKTVVPLYVCSSFQVNLIEVAEDMTSDWLAKKDEYGRRVVQQFLENLCDPQKKHAMDLLCG